MFALPNFGIKIDDTDALKVIEWAVTSCATPSPYILRILTVLHYIRRSGYRHFVETGTYQGTTSNIVAMLGLDVVTIELSEELHRQAVAKFADRANVTCLQGDSGTLMPGVVAGLTGPAVFWLDGHYSDVPFAGRAEKETPIVEELEAVFTAMAHDHVVLIDDMYCFGTGDYPTIAEVEAIVRRLRPDYQITVLNDIMRITPPGFSAA